MALASLVHKHREITVSEMLLPLERFATQSTSLHYRALIVSTQNQLLHLATAGQHLDQQMSVHALVLSQITLKMMLEFESTHRHHLPQQLGLHPRLLKRLHYHLILLVNDLYSNDFSLVRVISIP